MRCPQSSSAEVDSGISSERHVIHSTLWSVQGSVLSEVATLPKKETYILSGTITLGLNNDPRTLVRRSPRCLFAGMRSVLPPIDGVSDLEFGNRTTRIVFKVLVCEMGVLYAAVGPSRVEVVLIH